MHINGALAICYKPRFGLMDKACDMRLTTHGTIKTWVQTR